MKLTTLVFLVKDKSVYLATKKKGFGAGFLNAYGGKVEEGETAEQAAGRELREEAGVKAEKFEEMGVINFFDDQEQIFECHVFFAGEWQGEPSESEEMSVPERFKLSDVPYERMWQSDRVWLPLIFSGEKIRAKAYYSKGMKEFLRFEYKPLFKDPEHKNLNK